jgi:D-alanyl-D-alanine carboxypeptidase/D-alanyl-D-alanine-endopeptidase (penicillin-binding protein 4)
MRGTRAAGNVRAKTGSIANVRALSGFVETADGEMLVFSMLANNFTQPQAAIDHTIDLAAERLANFTRK